LLLPNVTTESIIVFQCKIHHTDGIYVTKHRRIRN